MDAVSRLAEQIRAKAGTLDAIYYGPAVPEMPTVDPAHLADLLWTMHTTKREHEALHPQGLLER